MKRHRKRARALFWLFTAIATIVSWIGFLWPPIAYSRAHPGLTAGDFAGLLLQFESPIYAPVPGLGWAFLLLSVGVGALAVRQAFALVRYAKHAAIGISILETTIEMVMIDASRSCVRRNQLFHANRSGITAYHLFYRTDAPRGRVDRASIHLHSFVARKEITKELLPRGGEKSIDVIEVFDQELPTSLFATIYPNWLVRWLYQTCGLFDRIIVSRQGDATYIDEHNGPEASLSLYAKFPISEVTIRLNFPSDACPLADSVRGFIIDDNVVIEVSVPVREEAQRSLYELRLRNLHNETVLLRWGNPPAAEPGL